MGCLIVLLTRFVSFSVPDLTLSSDLDSSGHPGTCVSRYWTGSDSIRGTILDAIDMLELCASKTSAVAPEGVSSVWALGVAYSY